MNRYFFKLVQNFTCWLDPKLQPYRPPAPPKKPYTPKTLPQLIQLLQRTPDTVLSLEDRRLISSVMAFRSKTVASLMLPASEITFVSSQEFLGPLTLDRLYRSGFEHFPVTDPEGTPIGTISIHALTSLKIKSTDQAEKYLDPHIYYLRSDYTLDQALNAFLRTSASFMMVINRQGKTVGLLSLRMLLEALFYLDLSDNFDQDDSLAAVKNR